MPTEQIPQMKALENSHFGWAMEIENHDRRFVLLVLAADRPNQRIESAGVS